MSFQRVLLGDDLLRLAMKGHLGCEKSDDSLEVDSFKNSSKISC